MNEANALIQEKIKHTNANKTKYFLEWVEFPHAVCFLVYLLARHKSRYKKIQLSLFKQINANIFHVDHLLSLKLLTKKKSIEWSL